MGGVGSGGANRLPIEEHLARGTFRPARHLAQVKPAAPVAAVTVAERRAVLKGLGHTGRKMASRLLDDYGDWDAAGLHTLRQYAISCDRLGDKLDESERHRELRANLALLRSMHLDSPR